MQHLSKKPLRSMDMDKATESVIAAVAVATAAAAMAAAVLVLTDGILLWKSLGF